MERTIISCDVCKGKNPKQAVERFLVKGMTSGKSFTIDLCGWHKQNFFPTNLQQTTSHSMQDVMAGTKEAAAEKEEEESSSSSLSNGTYEVAKKRTLAYGVFPCPEPECQGRKPFDTKQGLTLHTLRVHRQISTKRKVAV